VLDDEAGHVRARVAGDRDPFWFVLGQSANEGWELTVDGGVAGARQVVDGFANGWPITPDGDGAVTVTARWAPQRLVPIGFALSGVTVLACLVVLVRRRRAPATASATAVAAPTLALGAREPVATWRRSAAGVASVVAIGGLVATPPIAAAAGVATLLAARCRAVRPGLVLLAPVALAASRFDQRPSLAWLAVLAVVGAILSQPSPRSPREP
jgi:hypothetical protein